MGDRPNLASDLGSSFAQELILDLQECEPTFLDRPTIAAFVRGACERMNVCRHTAYYLEDSGIPRYHGRPEPSPKVVGGVQLTLDGSVLVRAFKERSEVYINAFRFAQFDDQAVASFAEHCFRGRIGWRHGFKRGLSF